MLLQEGHIAEFDRYDSFASVLYLEAHKLPPALGSYSAILHPNSMGFVKPRARMSFPCWENWLESSRLLCLCFLHNIQQIAILMLYISFHSTGMVWWFHGYVLWHPCSGTDRHPTFLNILLHLISTLTNYNVRCPIVWQLLTTSTEWILPSQARTLKVRDTILILILYDIRRLFQ